MKGSTLLLWPGSHTPNKQRETFSLRTACFTQSGSIAMNHTAHCDRFGLILQLRAACEAFYNNVDILDLCIFRGQISNKLLSRQ